MNVPKTDNNDRTHKNDANIPQHIANASFWIGASYEQFKSLVFESRRLCASSNTVLKEENNLPAITDWLFS